MPALSKFFPPEFYAIWYVKQIMWKSHASLLEMFTCKLHSNELDTKIVPIFQFCCFSNHNINYIISFLASEVGYICGDKRGDTCTATRYLEKLLQFLTSNWPKMTHFKLHRFQFWKIVWLGCVTMVVKGVFLVMHQQEVLPIKSGA